MRSAHSLLPLLVLAGALLAGCAAGPNEQPAEPTPSAYPRDIDAPPPEAVEEPPELIEPPDPDTPYTLFGRVTDLAGRPIHGAAVWIEGADLREPVNNMAVYLEGRNATIAMTDATGRFLFNLEGGFYFLLAEAPGYLPARSAPAPSDDTPTRVDFRLVSDDGVKIIAHRGSSYYAPENTLAAIHKAILLGAHLIEVDAQLTGDDQIVVIHDLEVDRTTNGTGSVRFQPVSAIRTLDAGAWFHETFRGEGIPTLVDVLELAREHGTRVIIDVKYANENADHTEQRVLETIRDSGMAGSAIFATFRPAGVSRCAVFEGPECALISRGPGTGAQIVGQARQLGAQTVMLRHNLTDVDAVTAAAAQGLRVFTWTLNEPEEWDPFLDLGLAGILTDRPGFLLDHINERALAAVAA